MQPIRRDHPLRLFFAGLVDNVFCSEVGMADPLLNDYITDLLVSFTHVDRLNTIRNAQDRKLEQVAAMLLAMSDDVPDEPTDRDVCMYRNIGDYSLFWAGVYPEHLPHSGRRRSDVLLDFVTQGKRSYAIVSELVPTTEEPPPMLYRHLSDEFEICLHGLGLVRRGMEKQSEKPGHGGELVW